jgi:hypothetical protein
MAAVFIFVTGPPAQRRTLTPGFSAWPTVRGAFHIHTNRSDGALDKVAIAAAARRAGFQFAIFTDHGDGTARPDPPQYIDDVLCIDATEISTNGGHYIALGIPGAPYRLGGDADAVVEDVARLGGFGVAAHAASPRQELAWTDWNLPVDAIEWLNADSEWRDESRLRLTRAFLDYFWRPAGALASLLDRPVATLAHWDEVSQSRRVLALAGHDAHGGVGAENGDRPGRRLHVPSYDATFRTFSLNVVLSRAMTGSALNDAAELVQSIRRGNIFTAVDAIAAPAFLDFTAAAGGTTVAGGGVLPPALGSARFIARSQLPAGATLVLLRHGRAIAETSGQVLEHDAAGPGAYRVEIRVSGAPGTPPVPWLVSNPVFRFAPAPETAVAPTPPATIVDLRAAPWHGESSDGSTATVTANDGAATLVYTLPGGVEASQFAALAVDLPTAPADSATVSFRGVSPQPMRVSVQLRFAQDGGIRWRKSVYLDGEEREVVIPIEQFRPADAMTTRPAIARATSLLFVVDLTNATPGAQGRVTVRDVRLGR